MRDWSTKTKLEFALAAGVFASIISIAIVWIGGLIGIFYISSWRELLVAAGKAFALVTLAVAIYLLATTFWTDNDRDVM